VREGVIPEERGFIMTLSDAVDWTQIIGGARDQIVIAGVQKPAQNRNVSFRGPAEAAGAIQGRENAVVGVTASVVARNGT